MREGERYVCNGEINCRGKSVNWVDSCRLSIVEKHQIILSNCDFGMDFFNEFRE